MKQMPASPQDMPGHYQSIQDGGTPAYYRYRALKEPTWGWEIVLYFFLGGIASGSYVVATLADLLGTSDDRRVSRTGRYVALVSTLVSPALLILDLGRPERFANMLRIVKSRSPMSMGTWGLGGLGLFSVLGVLKQLHEDRRLSERSWLGRLQGLVPLPVSGILGMLFAFFVGGYTGVLISFTNVPLWARNSLAQGPLFLTSSLSTGLAAISTVMSFMAGASPRTEAWLARAKDTVAVGEAGLMAGTLASLGPSARPLIGRTYGVPFWLGTVGLGLVAPLVLRRTTRKTSSREAHARQVAADICVLTSGLIFRWLTVTAGQRSARQPQEYFAFTKDEGRHRRLPGK